jgi:LacI family transcriptional regulator
MNKKPPKKVTIAEVAKSAGVSTATVGRVLGGYGYTSEEVRQKVRQTAERLSYRPNLLARGLITGKTKTIGFIAGDIQSPFYASVLSGISDEARALGFGVIVTNSDESLERELDAVRLLREKRVDGLILAPCDTSGSQHLRKAAKEAFPFVQIDRAVHGLVAASVTVNNREAARHAIASLVSAGHRKIAILAELEHGNSERLSGFLKRVAEGTVAPELSMPSWQRLFGYVEAHRAVGIEIDPTLIVRVGSYSFAQAKKCAFELLSSKERPTALFAADGLMSAAAIHAISELNISLPEQLSLIAFDDVDWMGLMKPAITTVAQPLPAIGRTAARMLLSSLQRGERPTDHVVLSTSLIWRGSVVAPLLSIPSDSKVLP